MAHSIPNAVLAAAGGATGHLHPAVWRANQLASFRTSTLPTGYASLADELPDGGWPTGALNELLMQQPGIGEMRLLLPALRHLQPRKVILIQPPHELQAVALATDNFTINRVLRIRTTRSADALWAAEQVLRSGAAGALLLWQPHVRNESLRRLHLAAQSSDIAFWLFRPLALTQDASPAPLRLALRPAAGGISIEIVKRRGPHLDTPVFVPLQVPAARPSFPEFDNAHLDVRDTADAAARGISTALV